MSTGALISRSDISQKYADRETRLLHELELALAERPPDDLTLAARVLELGKYYEEQKQFPIARDYYEQAIQIYTRKFGADSYFAVDARKRRARVLRGRR